MPRLNLEYLHGNRIHASDLSPTQHHGAVVLSETDNTQFLVVADGLDDLTKVHLIDLQLFKVHSSGDVGYVYILAQDSEVTIKCV